MQGEPPTKASTPTGAVFLSYASQDAEAAKRICDALGAAGIEVWFDQSELRGGDAWDQSIRKQIKTCALFIPVISQNTHARAEGYFRLEWKLAVDRSHLISADKAFLLPVVIDDTPDDERVPERFREVQWTRLPAGKTPPAFVERVQRLLSGEASTPSRVGAASGTPGAVGGRSSATSWSRPVLPVAVVVVVLGAMAYFAIERPWISKPAAPPSVADVATTPFNPPPHSIAVLPFVNMSGDRDQEYFSDGLSEELLNSLARINELQVAARTSSFYFKGEHAELSTIAHRLNVASVLEGSVRRSGNTIRVTAQLNNALTGYHMWSQTYDRNLDDVLTLQTEIAAAVTSALKITLLGGAAEKVELGGTHNPQAFDAYLRGVRLMRAATSRAEALGALEAYSEAIGFDSNYGLAYAARSLAQSDYITQWAGGPRLPAPTPLRREYPERARLDAERAIVLAPNLGEAHAALARFLETFALDYASAWKESERSVALAPGSATVLYEYSQHAALIGKSGTAIGAARRVVTLDPLNPLSHRALGDAFWIARRYKDATTAYQDAIEVDPSLPEAHARRGLAYYALGSYQTAKTVCEAKADNWEIWLCLTITERKLGLNGESDAQMRRLENWGGDAFAYQYAQIEAQRGQNTKAIEWLDSALRLGDPGLRRLKTDPLMDPLRSESRFQAIERALKFPD